MKSEDMTNLEQIRKAALSSRAPKSGSCDLEISPPEWAPFLDGFSRQHEGWLANISVTNGPKEPIEMSNCRLQGITIQRAGEKFRINISVVDGHSEQLIHSVPDPLRLTFKREISGAHEGLEIISADGSVTDLRFRAAARPETLDGVLAASMGQAEVFSSGV